MPNPFVWLGEQFQYLLFGPGFNTSSRSISPPPPPLRTSLVFDSHIMTESSGSGRGKNPQTISSAWDERNQWGDDSSRTWQGLTAQDRKAIMLDIYLNIPAASSCVDAIAKRIFSGGFVVEKVDEEGPDNNEHYDTLMEFLLRINPDWDFLQLGRSLVTDELIFGESYSEIIWKNGVPWNLLKVDCIPMGYQANKWGQIERFYQQMNSTMQKNYLDPRNIIRWWFPHPRASIDPFAPVEKVTDATLINKKMNLWMITFFQKGAKFAYYVEIPGGENEAERYITYFRQNHTGEKNAHIPPVAYGGAKFVALGNQGALEMDFEKGMDRTETTIYGAYGVPPAAVSVIRTGAMGGHSEAEQDKIFVCNACDPVKGNFFEKLNDRIVKRGFGIYDYRYSARYADYRSDESVAKVEDIRVRNGTRTIDETRLENGKKPYKTGGDVPIIVTTREVTPVPRLGDLEEEQRENAQVALQSAQAGADLAQTKAKQAKEPPAPVPAELQQPGQQNGNIPQKNEKKAGNGGNTGQNDEKSQQSKKQVKEESQQNTGMMIAFMLDPETAQRLAIPGGEPASELHVTLGYLGDMGDEPKDDLLRPHTSPGAIWRPIYSVTSTAQPLIGQVGGVGRFFPAETETTPVIALVDVPGLSEFRTRLVQAIEAAGYFVAGNHGYTPHITLAYIDKSAPMPIEAVPPLLLVFDTVMLCIGDERIPFKLGKEVGTTESMQYFTGKTELPQWVAPDVEQEMLRLREQGVIAVTSKAKPAACGPCLMNDGKTVKLGDSFPSGHQIKPYHPNCDCENIYIHGDDGGEK